MTVSALEKIDLKCNLMLRFSSRKYAMTADVQKMYRQVWIADDHLDFQGIVWRQTPSEPLQDYRLLRVTYGVSSASHLAVKSLQHCKNRT